ncbi:MAG: EutN/CcmL family microcompartment protein [Pirellulaceae bacterium]
MRIAKVIGTVTLNSCHPGFRGANLKLVVPLVTGDLVSDREPSDDTLVAWDQLGAGYGCYIALSEGPEAAQPFLPEVKAVDAYNTAILDQLDVDQTLVRTLLE